MEAGVDGATVHLVDLRRVRAFEGKRKLVTGFPRPIRLEAPNDVFRVEHEADSVRQECVHVAFFGHLWNIDAQQAVEADRPPQVGGHDADCVELRHSCDGNR